MRNENIQVKLGTSLKTLMAHPYQSNTLPGRILPSPQPSTSSKHYNSTDMIQTTIPYSNIIIYNNNFEIKTHHYAPFPPQRGCRYTVFAILLVSVFEGSDTVVNLVHMFSKSQVSPGKSE